MIRTSQAKEKAADIEENLIVGLASGRLLSKNSHAPKPYIFAAILAYSVGVTFILLFLRPSNGLPQSSQLSSAVKVGNAHINSIDFKAFDDELIPSNEVVDVNIGTNDSPMKALDGRHRILVDPLFYACEYISRITTNASAFCLAVSDYSGFAVFREYNEAARGQSSSLSEVGAGTSHEMFEPLSKRTVLVLEANVLFSAIHDKKSTIHRLKLDMQGHDLTTLTNIKGLLKDTNLVTHIMAECFIPNGEGKQIYQIDNSCEKMSQLLQDVGYETKVTRATSEWGDTIAYKKSLASDFLSEADFDA